MVVGGCFPPIWKIFIQLDHLLLKDWDENSFNKKNFETILTILMFPKTVVPPNHPF